MGTHKATPKNTVTRLRKRVTARIKSVDKYHSDMVLPDFEETLQALPTVQEQIKLCRQWLAMYRALLKPDVKELWKGA